ncbi:hypothetical protein CYR52_14510 [Chimaeribacter arupi]|uniref:Glycosyl hydrolase family 78 alpha-rhamnosidase N-terminal domain-containing protein n=1 Tax=Chimaeribacter arupi TaxID=2060066 RepID=A0A2N5EIY3_9GAMM|nr:hypothetical protein CYR34_18100 [Chimaeribacter arupi]PLR47467.1 hypothetical protein CYR52_14510 [Chimaeribacter arupi]
MTCLKAVVLPAQAEPVGSPPDAPAHLHVTFGEIIDEVAETLTGYHGWLSTSWFQQQDIYLNVLPAQANATAPVFWRRRNRSG